MVEIQNVIDLYREYKSIWKVGEMLSISGQKVHSILVKNGINCSRKKEFTEGQISELIELYSTMVYGDGSLDAFSQKHGISKPNICRKARKLGLTKRSREYSDSMKEKLSQRAKKQIKENGHPRGMLGKTHSVENRQKISERTRKMWDDPNSKFNSLENRQKISDRVSKSIQERIRTNNSNIYSRCKRGWININGRELFVRSSWEANMCSYFEYLKMNGEILDWNYETKVFSFDKIKRGIRSYCPDFEITPIKGDNYFIEVKGYMDDKSKTKIKRMKIYYPKIRLDIIDQKAYKEISKNKHLYIGWDSLL